VEYLHKEMHVIHRDIKPQNILINQKGEVKITDFGVCSELAHTCDVANTFTGTAKYMSPERLTARSYTLKSDIWSLGIVLYHCCRSLSLWRGIIRNYKFLVSFNGYCKW